MYITKEALREFSEKVLFTIGKNETSKTSIPYYIEKNQFQMKSFKKIQRKKNKKLLVQINNFHFNKDRVSDARGLRRMLKRIMLVGLKSIHCEEDEKTFCNF